MQQLTVPAWHAAGAQGPRLHNADAVASYTRPGSGAVAFALADGVGDDPAAARAAQLASAAAVRADTTDPAEAVLAAQAALAADPTASDCVLVVALPSGDGSYRIGWVGDSRAYAANGDSIRQVTTDHTLANYFRSRGATPNPRMEHVVTVSVRTTKPSEIGTVEVLRPDFLVLASDGVHGRVDNAVLTQALRYAHDPAAALVEAATTAGTTDNATALVVQCVRDEITVALPVAA